MTARRLTLIVWAQAAREIEEASEWWHANRQATPNALSEDLERAFALITLQPGIGAPARSGRLDQGEVQVLRFRHVRRRPGPAA